MSCIMSRPKASHTLTPARAPGVRVWLRHCTTCAQYIVLIKMCESTVVLLAIAEPSSRKTLENPGKFPQYPGNFLKVVGRYADG